MNVEGNDIVIRFSADTGQADKSVNTLVKNLEKLRDALAGFDNGLVQRLERIADAINKIGASGTNISGLARELKKLGNVDVGKNQRDLKELASAVNNTKVTMGNTKQQSGASGFFTTIGKSAKTAAKSVWAFATLLPKKALSDLRGRLEGVAKGFKTFTASIGRIAFYRLIRTAIKAVTQGFQEGIKNAYFWAKEVGNQFAASMDTIKTATNYMKNSLGAMVAPLLNSLAPAIDFIIDRFVDLLNIVNQVFALLGGQSTWFKALKYPAEYMEETAGATAKARKELKLWLASFDELNIIPNQNDTGRGGGAGDALDYGSMFEEVDLQNPLKEAIESGDWEGLGRLLAEKINGFFDTVDFVSLGKKFAKRFQGIVDVVYGFLMKLDFSKVGKKIAEMMSAEISNIDWKKVGAIKVRKWTALIDLIAGFIGKLDWEEVGKAFGDYFKGALEHLSDWIIRIDWEQAGRDLVDKMVEFVNGLDLDTVISNLGQTLANASTALFGFLKGILERIWEYIQFQIYLDHPKMAEFFGIEGEKLAKKFAKEFDGDLQAGVSGAMDGIKTTIKESKPELVSEMKDLNAAMGDPIVKGLPGTKDFIESEFNEISKIMKKFSSDVDKTFATKRTMLLSVAIDKVSVPKFKVEYEDVSGVNLPVITARPHNIPMAYANGGFPEDGLFYANHGELVGKFNNGKTAVANNEQIIEGIKRGVAEGMSESGQGGNIYLQANLDGKVLFDAVCDRITDYFVQTGMTPFPV